MNSLQFVNLQEIRRIRNKISDSFLLCKILADVFRLNALYMIMKAGSGHIGSSFSSMDIVTWLWVKELINPNNFSSKESDTYFSSKGHDVPALYSLLIGLEKLDFGLIHKLRRLGGLPGHPDIAATPYIVTNTGPLGMGISKARGMALANRLSGKKGHFYVLTGDGEFQEGQIWESLQPTANGKFSEITVIVDHNKIQSDMPVNKVSDLGDLGKKFRSFGWEVARCDGHNFEELKKVFAYFKTIKDRPQILIANTIKGKGVSFMEALAEDGLYKFHSGAPSVENYQAASRELLNRINQYLRKNKQASLKLEFVELPERGAVKNPQKLVSVYGDELVKIAKKRKDIVVLDADLMFDCGLIPFKKEFPNRFIECGIAEQDMVSVAGGLALKNKLPIVHSFACFLSTRPNEQIYNNASENKKIIYVGTLAGLLPAMPGHSHQSVREISTIGGIPNLVLIQPSNEEETRMALRWAVEKNDKSTYLRLISIQCENLFNLPINYSLKIGQGVFLRKGSDAAIIAYGPLMLGEATKAAIKLSQEGISLAVINLPWLNRIDDKWLIGAIKKYKVLFTLDDHYVDLGQGTLISGIIAKNLTAIPKIISFGVEKMPVSGQNEEVLKHHSLDFESLAKRIEKNL